MKLRRAYLPFTLLLGLILLGPGCAKAPSDRPNDRLHDGQMTAEIQAKFKQDSGLQDKAITLEVSQGVVTLAGRVDNDNQRTAAARYASTTPGIREVVNNLQIGATNAPSSSAPPAMQAANAPTSNSAESNPRPSAAVAAHPQTQQNSKPRGSATRASVNSDSVMTASPANSENMANVPSPNSVPADSAPTLAERQDDAHRPDPAPDAPMPSESKPEPRLMTIESGTTLAVRLVDAIDSETAKQGQTFRATLDSPLSVEWDVAIPAGCNVEGHVVEVKSAGKFAGQSELVVTLDRILVPDKSYAIQTDDVRRKGKNQSTKTAEKVGAGAAIGAIIGGIVGGGKGAGIGAAAGGGAGAATQAASKAQPVRLESETVLNFTLQSPVTVEQEPENDRRKLRPAK